jgi:predicted MPP superfamily phosphohydrolase
MKHNAPNPKKKLRKLLPALTLTFAAVFAALLIDSNFRLVVTRYTVGGKRLPPEFNGYRIVLLSDLHGRRFGKDCEYLLGEVRGLNPDVIAIAGDFISEENDLAAVTETLAGLVKIAPVYCVTGNHDWASGYIKALMSVIADTGAVCLRNEFITLEKNGASIVLCGVEDPNSWSDMERPDSAAARARAAYPDGYIALMGHRNYWLDTYPDIDMDIILCGHGHGGIIRLPFINGLIDVNRSLFPKYAGGAYQGELYTMVVSRGLGQSPVFPRFLNNPEIVLITLAE